MKKDFLLLLTILLWVPLSACQQDTSSQIRLGTNIWPGYEPLYLAQQLGKIDSDIRLIEYPSASEVIRAFRNNALEAASLTLDEAIKLNQSIPIQIVLVHDISTGADAIISQPNVNTVAELKTKRIGVESTALGAFFLTRALEMHGMNSKDVIIKHLDINFHQQAYINNEVDALVTFEPVRSQLLARGAKEIYSSKDIPGEIVDVMVVKSQVIRSSPSKIQRLVESWFSTLEFIQEQPQAAQAIMAKHLNLPADAGDDIFAGLELPNRSENLHLLGGKEPKLVKTIDKLNTVLINNKIIRTKKLKPELLIDSSFIR